jgi:HEAT repeat protein
MTRARTSIAVVAAGSLLFVATLIGIRMLRRPSMAEVERKLEVGDVSGAAEEVSKQGFNQAKNLEAVKRFSVLILRQGLKERDPYERCYAAAALAEAGEGTGIPLLRAAYDAPEPTLRMAAIDGLGEIKAPESTALLKTLYQSSQVVERRVLLEALARSGDPQVIGLLLDAAGGSDQVTRLTAIRGLAKSGDRRAAPQVADLMASNQDPLERAEIGRALIGLGNKRVGIEIATSSLHNRKRPEVRAIGALALGEARDPAVVPELRQAMSDGDADVKLATAIALTHYQDATAVAYLKAAVLHDDGLTREHISQLLDGIDFAAGRPVVLAAMASPDENLSMSATRTIGLLGGESEISVLREGLRSTKDPIQRAGIAWAFGRIARAGCIPELMAMVPEADPAVRYTAADALDRTASRLLAKKTERRGPNI